MKNDDYQNHRIRRQKRHDPLKTYTEDGFLTSSLDITDEAVALVIEKLFDDYNLDGSGELVIRKSEPSRKIGKIKLK